MNVEFEDDMGGSSMKAVELMDLSKSYDQQQDMLKPDQSFH